MSRHDAFGNELHEPAQRTRGLPGMPERDGPRTGRDPGPPERRRVTALVLATIAVAAVLTASLLAIVGLSGEPDRVPSAPGLTPTTPRKPPPAGPAAVSGDSLFAPSRLRERLAILEEEEFEGLSSMVVKPDGIVVVLRRNDNRSELVRLGPTGPPEVLDTPPAGADTALLSISDIDPSVPERLVAQVVEQGRRPGAIEYVAINLVDDEPGWQVQMDDGTVFLAEADGFVYDQRP